MSMKKNYHRIPDRDPISGGKLYISELSTEDHDVTIRGQFALSPYAKLSEEEAHFLEIFLRNRGMLNGVEKQLGISYPTARGRLDQLLESLGYLPPKGETPVNRLEILEMLDRGELSVEEAKARLATEN